MAGSLSGLRVRRRGNVGASSGAPPLEIEQPTASLDATSSSLELSDNKKSEKSSTISSYVGVLVKFYGALLLVMLVVVPIAINHKISANNSRDEHITAAKHIMLPEEDTPSLLRVRHSFAKRYPRTVAISQSEPTILTDMPYTIDFELNSIDSSDITEPYFPDLVKGYNMDVCKPKHDWQSKSFPNCNMFHEANLSEMSFITSGTLRSVFELSENIDGNINKFVYKNLDYYGKHNVDLKRVDQERKDALILERTTSSQYIPSIHAYCSTAVIMDHAPRDMERYNEERLERSITVSPLDRLKICIHIASGVADLHSVDFIHNDLHEQQFLYQDGLFKLNDFNYAKPVYVDMNTNETCAISEKFSMGLFGRSLEEMQYKVDYEGFTPVKPDKIDVWMMGNLLYRVLTDLQVWNNKKRRNEKVKLKQAKRLVAGERPPIPEHILESNDSAHIAMMNALDMTWKYNWMERPSARSIADYLIRELRTITGEEAPDLRINFLNEVF
eukprot:scaffold6077_cov80-Skeletonema_dohrnii-CCMP3373.AAC.1